jgi:hypothetical protein
LFRAAEIPASLIEKYGQPDDISTLYANWTCPHCGYPKTWSYNFRTGWVSCFACGKSVGPGVLGARKESVALPVAAQRHKGRPGEWQIQRVNMLSTPNAFDYMTKRGLTLDEIQEHCWMQVGQAEWYVTFLCEEDGDPVSWHARCWREDLMQVEGRGPRKWMSPDPFTSGWASTKETVWGLPRIFPDEPVWVTEGILDAFYFPRGVSQMGPDSTETQKIKVLDRRPSRVIICRDNDAAGQRRPDGAILREWRKLNRHIEYEILNPPEGVKDFGELVQRGERHGISGD